ncbi:MAG: gamma-glutamylcyclotransferase family protein [Methylovirgula sp.]
MPLYFAYGSNMDRQAMRLRCPGSRPLGLARLARHKFFIMGSGYASVKCDARADVHGVLYDLALSDVSALDRYEDIGRGLYRKVAQPVLRAVGAPMRALVYIGGSDVEGTPAAAYLNAILAAARDWSLPAAYVSYLASFGASATAPEAPRRAIQGKGV